MNETLQHLTREELRRYGGKIIDVTAEVTESKPVEPKRLPPAEY